MEKKKTNGKRGGQPGNRNAVKTGGHTREKREHAEQDRCFFHNARMTLSVLHPATPRP